MPANAPAVHRYERVTYRPEGAARSRTVYLHRPAVSVSPVLGETITGVQVNSEGDEVAAAGYDVRRHVISTSLVTSRVPMRMSRTYGELVEVDLTCNGDATS